MNRAQLTAQIAEKAGLSKNQAGKLLNTVLGCIADNICEGDGEVAIPDFGRFYIKSCQARTKRVLKSKPMTKSPLRLLKTWQFTAASILRSNPQGVY